MIDDRIDAGSMQGRCSRLAVDFDVLALVGAIAVVYSRVERGSKDAGGSMKEGVARTTAQSHYQVPVPVQYR